MKPGKIVAVVGAFAFIAIGSYVLGKATRPADDPARQHVNESMDPHVFANSCLGLTVRPPREGNWRLAWEPSTLRPVPTNVNKVLEIERLLPADGSDKEWARMDLFVEPLYSSAGIPHAVRELEFREKRRGFRMLSEEQFSISGLPGRVRLGTWAVAGTGYRAVNYHVEHDGKLFAFVGVARAKAFDRFEPAFREILSSVRLR